MGENSKSTPDIAMVFAAGLGTRMRPITDTLPKPLVEVGGKTLLDHVLDSLVSAGIKKAIVNIHYLPALISDHLQHRNTPEIILSDESDKLLDQGGGIRKVLDTIGSDSFFITNTDSFWCGNPGSKTGSNIQRLAQQWDPDVMDVLLLLAPVTNSIGVDWKGDYLMHTDGTLERRGTRTSVPYVYAGVGIVKKSLFEDETQDVFGLSPFFDQAQAKGRLHGIELDGLWLHVGTPEAIEQANRALAELAN